MTTSGRSSPDDQRFFGPRPSCRSRRRCRPLSRAVEVLPAAGGGNDLAARAFLTGDGGADAALQAVAVAGRAEDLNVVDAVVVAVKTLERCALVGSVVGSPRFDRDLGTA